MARRATGAVVERKRDRGRVYGLRFTAYGIRRFVTLPDGTTHSQAEHELQNVLADVRRGVWRPDEPPAEATPPMPTFHVFASAWFENKRPELAAKTETDYRWRLSNHLLPYFQHLRLNEITVEQVDAYRSAKLREAQLREAQRLARARVSGEAAPKPLSNSSINMTIRLLAAVLERAVEYGYIDRNPASGSKRLLRQAKPSRSYLQPDQVAALLTAARGLDTEARAGDTGRRRPLLATLTLAGLRISEGLDLRWRDVNLGARKLRVVQAKTEAGVREVDVSPTLAELLGEYRTRSRHTGSDDLVFPTANGQRDNPSNVRNRYLANAVEVANGTLACDGAQAIGKVTPHSLRRTFASLLLAAGADVPYVMAQLGHTDPKMTLGVYAKVIATKTDHGQALDALIGATQSAPIGTSAPITAIAA
jgi:integrase